MSEIRKNYSDRSFWCEEGLPPSLDPETISRFEKKWEDTNDSDSQEKRAASIIFCLLGKAAYLYDDGTKKNGKNSAVDLIVEHDGKTSEIIEVVSSLDSTFMNQRAKLRRLESEVNEYYSGNLSWNIILGHGWSSPKVNSLVVANFLKLNEGKDLSFVIDEINTLFPGLLVERIYFDDSASRGVSFSYSANSHFSDSPYLNRLSDFLGGNEVIKKRIEKLKSNKVELNSSRQHLYILVASFGSYGNLLGASPGFFTEGEFNCPNQIVTDIWLDGGNNLIFHWCIEKGFQYFEL